MRAGEFVTESLSRVAYHYTNISSANKILKSGQFELSAAPGSIEQQYAPPGKPYFLSTTRTKLGDFHRSRNASYGVIFALDGNWFNQRYRSGPVDYWGNRNPTATSHRGHEAEDRVFSAEPTIPIDGVTAVHVLANRDMSMPNYNAIVRSILIAAKARGIPAYFYEDVEPWLNLDTRHTGDVSWLKGREHVSTYFPARGKLRPHYLEHWIELMMKNDQSQLSGKADQMRYSLNYTYDKKDAVAALANEFANARKPDSGPERDAVVKILAYMRQHKLNTISDFVNHMAAKWKTNK
jgi:hypothetical protein